MRKTIIRKAGIWVVIALMVMSLFASQVSAAEHDDTEDVSSEQAILVLGKELSYRNKQYNPVEKVKYKIEKVKAWHNENESTEANGTPIEVSEMPDPEFSDVEITLTDHSNGFATGKENVGIVFEQAGYYVYRITEYPITVNDAETESDDHSYFAVIYVCNKTDEDGNTVPGVYVHDITSYRNNSGMEEYEPDLSDIARTTDNNGEEAKENNEGELGKVGKSSHDKPNVLEAYKMWNKVRYPDPVDLTVTKNVTGSLGDLTKQFEFIVTISGAEAGGKYKLSGTGEINGLPSAGEYDDMTGELISDNVGTITFEYIMKDNQTLTIEDLPEGAEWSVVERASNHKASCTVTPEECAFEASKENPDSDMELTAEGRLLENTAVDFVNERDMTIVTGVNVDFPAYVGAIAAFMLAALLIAAFSIKGRRKHEMES